jgi:hypothetical protein
MTQSVATDEDIIATVSLLPPPNCTGAWTHSVIEIKSYAHFTIEHKPVAYEASCTFKFEGTDNTIPSSPHKTEGPQYEEKITLNAKKNNLQTESNGVLCHGNKKIGRKGNSLEVRVRNHLIKVSR